MLAAPSFAGFPFPGGSEEHLPVSTSGLLLWLDATKGIGLDGATTRVASWASRVGSASATQATTSLMPVVSLMNGRASVRFDAADDTLVLSGAPTVGAASTALVAFAVGPETSYRGLVYGGTGSYGLQVTGDRRLKLAKWGVADLVETAVEAVSATLPTLACVTYDGSTAAIRLNRAGAAVAMATEGFTAATDHVGAYLTGLVSEVLLYARVLSAAEIAQAEGYLATKWGTA